jgi:hypothetical protein
MSVSVLAAARNELASFIDACVSSKAFLSAGDARLLAGTVFFFQAACKSMRMLELCSAISKEFLSSSCIFSKINCFLREVSCALTSAVKLVDLICDSIATISEYIFSSSARLEISMSAFLSSANICSSR